MWNPSERAFPGASPISRRDREGWGAKPVLVVLRREGVLPRAFPAPRGGSRPPLLVARWDRLPPVLFPERAVASLVCQLPAEAPDRVRKVLRRWRRSRGGPLLTFSLHSHSRAREESESLGVATHLRCPFPLQGLLELLDRDAGLLRVQGRWREARRLLREEQRKLGVMREISAAANSELDPDKVIRIVMEMARRILPCEDWSLFLAEETRNELIPRKPAGVRSDPRLAVGEGIPQWVVRRQEPLLWARRDGTTPERPPLKGNLGTGVRTLLCIPLRSRGRIMGALQLVNRKDGRDFTSQDMDFFLSLLEPASIAIENALLFRRAEELSVTDDLTRLFNARYLNQVLHREVERSRRYGQQVSLIFLDLDGFKNVNDRHGHLAGSRALVEVGAVLRGTVRAIDVVSRFGGDEFTVILPQTGVSGAATIAERIRSQLQEAVLLGDLGLKVRVTASLGVATFPDHGTNKDALIAQADRAMYSVKGKTKNAVEIAPSGSLSHHFEWLS